jgi:membrane peptidoglycan carboxypeptidase
MTKATGTTASGLKVPSANCHRVISADIANEATKILRGVLTQGTAAGDGLTSQGREAAGKTGTTDDQAEALFAGYTPQLAAEVWFGDPSAPFGNPSGQFGSFTAPYWQRSMLWALAGQRVENFTAPSGAYGSNNLPPANRPTKRTTPKRGGHNPSPPAHRTG